jgi:hypothetical protein
MDMSREEAALFLFDGDKAKAQLLLELLQIEEKEILSFKNLELNIPED